MKAAPVIPKRFTELQLALYDSVQVSIENPASTTDHSYTRYLSLTGSEIAIIRNQALSSENSKIIYH